MISWRKYSNLSLIKYHFTLKRKALLENEMHRKYFNIFGPIVFSIAGGVPGGSISWQVTGVRHDPSIIANPIIPEVLKTDTTIVKKGECISPPLCQ